MLYDLGTVRLFEVSGQLDVFFLRSDSLSLAVTKEFKGRWDPNRRSWRIDPRWARAEIPEIVDRFRREHMEIAPPKWRDNLKSLSRIVSTTKKFGIYLGEAGARIELPRGHKHEYTLKSNVNGAQLDGQMWLLPAAICPNVDAKRVLADVITDDRRALADAMDYLNGYTLTGGLKLAAAEDQAIGLEEGAVLCVDPSFVRKADASIPAEPLKAYVMRVVSVGPSDDPEADGTAKLAFVVGDEAHAFLRDVLATDAVKKPILDVRHIHGKWVRRRG